MPCHKAQYQFIAGRGTEAPTIDPGEMFFCEDTCQEGFDSTKVNAIQLNEDNGEESDKDSEGNSKEKMPKKIRKFVPNESDHKHLILIWWIKHLRVQNVS